jgi:hypothetical protein
VLLCKKDLICIVYVLKGEIKALATKNINFFKNKKIVFLTVARLVSDQVVAVLAGAPVSDGQVDALLIAASADLGGQVLEKKKNVFKVSLTAFSFTSMNP